MARERGETEGDMAKISEEGDENTRMELGSTHKADSGQEVLAFFGCGLMCDVRSHTKRIKQVNKVVGLPSQMFRCWELQCSSCGLISMSTAVSCGFS